MMMDAITQRDTPLNEARLCLWHQWLFPATDWLWWLLDVLNDSLEQALTAVTRTHNKARFWLMHNTAQLHAEQKRVLNRLLDGGEQGFAEGISASQYQKVAKVSKATATRHLVELVEKGCLEKLAGGGRSTRYQIKQ